MLISIIGGLVVVVALLDLFLTVLDANGFSLLSSRIYRAMWWVWRHGAKGLPPATRRAWLSYGAPLMIPGIVAMWFLLIVTGFALIYFGGMSPQSMVYGGGAQPSLENAFRLSWVTLSTIGFVEISPSSTSYSFTVAAEAIMGGVVLTMAITYFLRVHQVLLHFHCMATTLHHHAGDIARPETYLRTHFHDGEPQAMEPWLHDLVVDVVTLHEGLRRHPIVYYYHPRRQFRSLPFVVRTLSEITWGLLWGLPDDHPVRHHPSLRALGSALLVMIDDLEHRFVPVLHTSTVVPLPYQDFARAVEDEYGPADEWAARFLQLETAIRAIAGDLDRSPLPELYRRYRRWLPNEVRTTDFVRATGSDLGYGPRLAPDDTDVIDIIEQLQDGPSQRPQQLRSRVGRS